MILHGVSTHLMQGDQQNASISQLSDLNACLSDKLSCLGFENLLALHLTRLRQSPGGAGIRCRAYIISLINLQTTTPYIYNEITTNHS